MLYKELIVLHKTLIELLDKNFIRASSLLVSALVLFIRKPGGRLYLYIDY